MEQDVQAAAELGDTSAWAAMLGAGAGAAHDRAEHVAPDFAALAGTPGVGAGGEGSVGGGPGSRPGTAGMLGVSSSQPSAADPNGATSSEPDPTLILTQARPRQISAYGNLGTAAARAAAAWPQPFSRAAGPSTLAPLDLGMLQARPRVRVRVCVCARACVSCGGGGEGWGREGGGMAACFVCVRPHAAPPAPSHHG